MVLKKKITIDNMQIIDIQLLPNDKLKELFDEAYSLKEMYTEKYDILEKEINKRGLEREY